MDTRNSTSKMTNKLCTHEVNQSNTANKVSNFSHSRNIKENEQNFGHMQENDHGDSKINSEIPVNAKTHQNRQYLAAGEFPTSVDHNLACQCNHEPRTSTWKTSPRSNGSLKFTQKMLQDQEQLVSSMTHQGISESLIHRHFERLLEEQTKQLRLHNDAKLMEQKKWKKEEVSKSEKPTKSEKMNYNTQEKAYNYNYNQAQTIDSHDSSHKSHISFNNMQENQEQPCGNTNEEESRTCPHSQESNGSRKVVEPSSLLKIRIQKEVVNSRSRNNGLQEDDVAIGIIQNNNYSKKPVRHDSLNDEDNMAYMKLNGTQDKAEMEKFQTMYASNTPISYEKRKPCNGLENTRDPNNPQIAPKSAKCQSLQLSEEASGVLYPAHKDYYYHPLLSMHSNNENQAYEQSDNYHHKNHAESHTRVENQKMPPQFSNEVCNQEQNHARSNRNNFTFWPDLQEPKIIGGLTYFARKAEYIPKNEFSQPKYGYVKKPELEN